MKSQVLKRRDYLALLTKHGQNAKKRKVLADMATKSDLDAVREICINLLRGNIPMSLAIQKKLKRHKKALRLLAQKRGTIKEKKKLIHQQGGFLHFLAPLAVSAVSSFLRK